jgi:hypothetical protein
VEVIEGVAGMVMAVAPVFADSAIDVAVIVALCAEFVAAGAV